VGGERQEEGKGGSRGKGEEMTQTLYAHMNKRKKKALGEEQNESDEIYGNSRRRKK
jgi:hypothetical protein